MSSPEWNISPVENYENYDSNINIQPTVQNPHNGDDRDTDNHIQDEVIDNAKIIESYFGSKEFSKADLYWNAMNVSRHLSEIFEETGQYAMIQFDPSGATPVIIGDEEQILVEESYDPLVFESDFNPFEYLDNTSYADKLKVAILNTEPSALTEDDLEYDDAKWKIPIENMAAQSETIIAAPGLEEQYREMAEQEILYKSQTL